jgi:hypothetical protein
MCIKVYIVEDEALVAQSLASLLNLEHDIEVVGVAESAEEFLNIGRKKDIDVLITDLNLIKMDGIDLANKIKETFTSIPQILVITSFAKAVEVKRAMSAGIAGFMPKTSNAKEFASAIRTLAAGGSYINQDLAIAAISIRESPLTPREAEVLSKVGSGKSIEEIAAECFLAPGTTRNYISSVIKKLSVNNRFEAHRLARENGWI